MKNCFAEYFSRLYHWMPDEVYEVGALIFILGIVLIILLTDRKKRKKYVARLLLTEYIILIFCSTVVFRDAKGIYKFKPASLEYYKELLDGNYMNVVPEMLMNIIVFIILGIFLSAAFKSINWCRVLVVGFGISMSIEILQYVLRRGTAEILDVILNVVGCLIGYWVYSSANNGYKNYYKRTVVNF